MRTGITVTVSPSVRRRLRAVARNRNSPQKHVWRAKIILLSADGVGTNEIMRQTGTSKTCVWRWQERFMAEGFDGLLRDKTRPSRVAPLGADVAERVVALTQSDPPAETTHWTALLMANEIGISVSSVQRIWRRHGLQPHRMRQFKLSNVPKFVGKLRDVVGLYVDPPAHAIVLSFDEKSQIQALDRTQPGLPMKKGRAGTMTHDYKRHGTTTLFAALDVLEGKVIGRCMQRHRHQEFIRFLNTIEAEVPAGKIVHVILDNYAAHKHPKVHAWLARHERFVFHRSISFLARRSSLARSRSIAAISASRNAQYQMRFHGPRKRHRARWGMMASARRISKQASSANVHGLRVRGTRSVALKTAMELFPHPNVTQTYFEG